MSFLSYCNTCGGWRWTCGPDMLDELVKLKREQLANMTPDERKQQIPTPTPSRPREPGECTCQDYNP